MTQGHYIVYSWANTTQIGAISLCSLQPERCPWALWRDEKVNPPLITTHCSTKSKILITQEELNKLLIFKKGYDDKIGEGKTKVTTLEQNLVDKK